MRPLLVHFCERAINDQEPSVFVSITTDGSITGLNQITHSTHFTSPNKDINDCAKSPFYTLFQKLHFLT